MRPAAPGRDEHAPAVVGPSGLRGRARRRSVPVGVVTLALASTGCFVVALWSTASSTAGSVTGPDAVRARIASSAGDRAAVRIAAWRTADTPRALSRTVTFEDGRTVSDRFDRDARCGP
jgi:hypothetical protein